MVPDNLMQIDIIIGASIGIIIVLILLCGLRNCLCKSSDSSSASNTRIWTKNNSLSVNNRVQNEEDCNSQPGYPEDIDQRLERTEDL